MYSVIETEILEHIKSHYQRLAKKFGETKALSFLKTLIFLGENEKKIRAGIRVCRDQSSWDLFSNHFNQQQVQDLFKQIRGFTQLKEVTLAVDERDFFSEIGKIMRDVYHLLHEDDSTWIEKFSEVRESESIFVIHQKIRLKKITQSHKRVNTIHTVERIDFYNLTRYSDAQKYMKRIDEISNDVIEQTILQNDTQRSLLVHWSAIYQTPESFLCLLEKISPYVIANCIALKYKDFTLLELAAQYQSTFAFCALLLRIDAQTINQLAIMKNEHIKEVGKLRNILGMLFRFQSPKAVNFFLSRLAPQTIEQLIAQDPVMFSKLYVLCLTDDSMNDLSAVQLSVMLETNGVLAFCWMQKEKGKIFPDGLERAMQNLNIMPQEFSRRLETPCNRSLENFETKISKGELAIKMVSTANRADFIKMLHDKNFRPSLRVEKKAQFKLDFTTGTVIPYVKKAKKTEPMYTKKTSVTAISPSYLTPTYDAHHDLADHVGFLLDTKKCNIKTCFTATKASHFKNWVNDDKKQLWAYNSTIRNSVFTNFEKFKHRVFENVFSINEVLVQIPYDSVSEVILAVVITQNGYIEHQLAQDTVTAFKETFGLELPVVYYDRYNQNIEIVELESLGSDVSTQPSFSR